ncbi:ParB/RepB/Spo0J family partition protein [Tropicibacter sp. R16_0]|uniref:ParB/RepB/Spo0J family partition protein n=1 Tax=Tropicibacter sp. R16_0 TaxID=2821102 RepID=UPI001AD9804A|nr:ParB/RepB/Spo0J family partition protein [Tropicibacter sp. R16_0]MBO9452279.1 ParB/RepB/Spo0J family partition protein [Tropicibacter sp. R16_0]
MQKKLMMILPRQITFDPAFSYRDEPRKVKRKAGEGEKKPTNISGTHLAALRKTLRNTGQLDPILVWQEADEAGEATGRLVLLDGHYRVAAYQAEQAQGTITGNAIPARVLIGPRSLAALASLHANAKDTLPLSQTERLNAAWRLVREYGKSISMPKLATASGVSARTVSSMRKQAKAFSEALEAPSGDWRVDRHWPDEGDFTPPSDEEKQAKIQAIAAAVRGALKEQRTRDAETIGDALADAMDQHTLRLVLDYLTGEDSEAIALMAVDDVDGGREREPAMGPESDFR